MQKRFLLTLAVAFGWAFFVPAPWVDSVQAQVVLNTSGRFDTYLASNPRNGVDNGWGAGTYYGAAVTVNLTSGTTYTFLLSGGDTYMYLYDPNNTYITEDDDSGNPPDGYNGNAKIVYTATATGTYTAYCTTWATVEQEQYFGTGYSTFAWNLQVDGSGTAPTTVPPSPTAVTIPVNTSGSLTAASYNSNFGGTQLSASDNPYYPMWGGHWQDWYSVTLTAGKTYVITMATSGDSVLSVQDGSYTEVAFNDDTPTGADLSSYLTFTPTITGTYYIICSTWWPQTSLTYTLTIPDPDTGASGSPPTPPSPTVQSGTVLLDYSAAMNTPVGGPCYRAANNGFSQSVSLTAGNTYQMLLEYTGDQTVVWPDDDTYLYLYDSSGNLIAEDDDSGYLYQHDNNGYATFGAALITYTPTVSGTYTLYCTTTYAGVTMSTARLYVTFTAPPTTTPTDLPNVRLTPRRERPGEVRPESAWTLSPQRDCFLIATQAVARGCWISSATNHRIA